MSAKLVYLDGPARLVARVFLVPGRERFILSELTAGSYDLRYRDLTSGALSRSERLSFEETVSDDGIRFTEMRVTLYKVRGGNMKTFALGEDDFE